MKIYQPRAELRSYVRYYWALEGDEPFSVLTFPIGCPQIIFHKKSPLYIPELDKKQSQFTISGQVNFPAHIQSDGGLEMIVAVLYPHTIGMFIDKHPDGMRVENRHYHFQTAVRLDMRRKIHLSANSKLRLFLIKFRYVKRRFLVKNNLRTTDRKGQDAERLIAFQRPIVAHIGAQFRSRLIDFHQCSIIKQSATVVPIPYHLAMLTCIDQFCES